MAHEKHFLIEKAISISLVAVAVLALTSSQLFTTFIVLGHGHFFIAYLYQYRAGKMTASYAAGYIAAFIAILAAFLHTGRIDLLIVTAAFVFLVHFLQDEVMLAGKKPALMRTLEMSPILLLYTGLILHRALQIRLLPTIALLSLGIIAIYGVLLYTKKQRPDLLSGYFLSISTLLLSLAALKQIPNLQELLGSLILLHYLSWYIAYFFKVRAAPTRLRSYIASVLCCNALALVLYIIFVTSSGKYWLGFLFLPGYFYVWTLMHTLFSIRWNDWKGVLK